MAGTLVAAPLVWVSDARAPTVCRPVRVMSVALKAATIHNARAAKVVARPGLRLILAHLVSPTADTYSGADAGSASVGGGDPAAGTSCRSSAAADGTSCRLSAAADGTSCGPSAPDGARPSARSGAGPTCRSAWSRHRRSTGSRNPGGSGAGGSRPASTSGRIPPGLRPAHVGHSSTCRLTRSAVGTVSRPSQPVSSTSSAGQLCWAVRAMSSAPSVLSS